MIPTTCLNKQSDAVVHFSIDDSNAIFEDLTLNKAKYKSIFEQPTLSFIKELHDKYDITVTFYCFYSWDSENIEKFNLSNATDKYSGNFTENSAWLKFGFHAYDANSYKNMDSDMQLEYYNCVIEQLIRITGTDKCIDRFVRLDRFVSNDDILQELSKTKYGITGLFCSDTFDRDSYDLSYSEKTQLFANDIYIKNNLVYTLTDIRIENIKNNLDFYNCINRVKYQDTVVIFTHEWYLDDNNVRQYFENLANYACKSDLKNTFS